MTNLFVRKCVFREFVLEKLDRIELPFDEMQQLKSLVKELGYLGAINYLRPLKWNNPNRDQYLADKHRDILENRLG